VPEYAPNIQEVFNVKRVFIWFYLLSISTLFQIPIKTIKPAQSALVTFATSGYWGLVTAYLLKFLLARLAFNKKEPKKIKIHKYHILPVPAQKKEPQKRVDFKKPKKLPKV
jgi:hypothetical protein